MKLLVVISFVLLLLVGCNVKSDEKKITYNDLDPEYEIQKIKDGQITYEKKRLSQISEEDLTDGAFVYRTESGELIVTDISTAQDGALVAAYPPPDKDHIMKYDDHTGKDQYFVKYESSLIEDPRLKPLGTDFFMKDYEVNAYCDWWLESYHRLKACDFSIGCEIEADHYFEKLCFTRIAQLKNDETWCEKIRLNYDSSCLKEMAWQKKDKNVCWKIKGDAISCFNDLARRTGNLSICNDVKPWVLYISNEIDNSSSESINKAVEKYANNESRLCFEANKKYNVTNFQQCLGLRFPNSSNCFETAKYKNQSLSSGECRKLSFKNVGYCLGVFGINGEYMEQDSKYGPNICDFDTFPSETEIPIAGMVISKGKIKQGNYFSVMPIFGVKFSCSDIDCRNNQSLNLTDGQGVLLSTEKRIINGSTKCFVKNVNASYNISSK